VIDTLIFMSQRSVVITLAVIGALLVMAGSLAHKPEHAQSGKAKATRTDRKHISPHQATRSPLAAFCCSSSQDLSLTFGP